MGLMPVADALAAVLAGAEPLPEEMVGLAPHIIGCWRAISPRAHPTSDRDVGDGWLRRARG